MKLQIINNSYFSGNVNGGLAGGLVGQITSGTISNSYATGTVNGSIGAGGLVGYYGGGTGTITNSYWDITTSGQATSSGGTGLTTAKMQQQTSFVGWDFVNTWEILPGATHPTLKAAVSNAQVVTPPIVTPPTGLTAAQALLVQQHQNDSVFQLLLAIADGLFTNSNTDPVWVGMYQSVGSAPPSATAVQIAANTQRNIYDAYTSANIFALILSGQLLNDSNDTTWHSIYRNGQATAAQVDANAFANTYNQYQGKTANVLFAGIVAGDLNPSPSAANAVVWDALKNQNLPGTNRAAMMAGIYDTYKNADVATLTSGLSKNPPDLVYGDTVWNALTAVNATNLTAAYNAYTNPAPTSTLTARQQQLVDLYKGKPADHLFWALVDTPVQFTNNPTDPVWSALYDGGIATPAQQDANAMKIVFDRYKNAGWETLLQALKSNDLVRDGMGGNIWTALTEINPDSTRIALTQYMLYRTTLPNDPSRDGVVNNGNNPGSVSDSTECTLGAYICGGGGLGDGSGLDSGNGTAVTGAGTWNAGTEGYGVLIPLNQIVPSTPFDKSSVDNIFKRADLTDSGNLRKVIQVFFVDGMTVNENGFGFKAGGWSVFKDYVSGIGKQYLIESLYKDKLISVAARDFWSKLIDMTDESIVEPFIRLHNNEPGVGNGGTELANLFDKTSVGQFMIENSGRKVGGDAPATNDLTNAVVDSLSNNGAEMIANNGGWSRWLSKTWSGK